MTIFKPVLTVALLFLAASVATAANVTLKASDAAGTTSFTGLNNWNNGAAPSSANAYFTTNFTIRTPAPTTSGSTYTFGGASLSIDPGGRLLGKIGNNAAGNSTTATISANFILNGGYMDQAGANSDTPVLTVAGTVAVNAASGLGALGGTANGSASFETMDITAVVSGSAGLQISGGGLNTGEDTGVVRLSAANPYSGTISVSNAASDIIASSVNRILQINNLDAVSNATLNFTAAQANPVSFRSTANTGVFDLGAITGKGSQTLTDTTGLPVTLSVGGNNASTTFGGDLTDSGSLVKVGLGTLTLTGTNSCYGATTVNAGSLQLGGGGVGGSLSSASTLTVNGNLAINRNNAVVQGIDFSGGPITGTGSFTQAGTGITTLNAANSYSGATTVSAGGLVISSAQTGTGAITVASGASLDIAVSGTSQLAPNALTLGTSTAATLEFDGLNSTTIAPVNAGTVSLGGPVTINIGSGTFAAGNNYPLIHWTGSGPASTSGFTLGFSPGLTATFSVANSTLYLNVAAVSDIWTGAVNGNWDTSTANWTGSATVFANGQAVLFDDTAVGNTSLTVTTPVQPGGITVNNSVLFYTITSSGANAIGGSGSLTVQNTGSLTLSGGANTYTGATIINKGTLSVGALANSGQPSDIGSATADPANLAFNGGTLQYTGGSAGTDHGATLGANGGAIQVANGGTILTNSGVIIGSGSLALTGSGTVTLSGASTFSGGLALDAGGLDVNFGGSTPTNSAIGTGTFTIAANTTIDNTSGADVTLLPNNAQIWDGGFIYAGSANSLNLGAGPVSLPVTNNLAVNGYTLTVGGVVSGPGGITKTGPGTLVLSGASTFTGTIDLQAGTLAIGNDQSVGKGLFNFDGGTSGATIQSLDGSAHLITNAINFAGASAVTIFGGTGNLKFTGTPTPNGTAKTFIVNNPQTEFSGVLGGASARTIGGTGTLILSGANTYSAGTTINPGATLQLGNGGTNGLLSTAGAIEDDGTLTFDRTNAVVQGVDFSATPIIGAGSVVQAGAGTTTLNAANTFSGSMVVSNGELLITPAYVAGGNVAVGNGAKFGVSASSVSNSATIGSLTLGTGGATTLDFSYGLNGNPTNAVLAAGAVTINGASSIRIGGTFVTGTFPVLSYTSLSGTFATTVVGPRGVTATLFNNTASQTIYVTISSVGSGIVWTGTNSVSPGLWDLNTTTNWVIGGLPTDYLETVPPGDAVTFNDSGSGLVLLSNTVSPASVTINNSTVNYTFQGTGQITSPGGLTKTGAATVTMNVPGTFAGSSVLSNGTFSIGASQTLANLSGNSPVTVSTGAPTFTVNDSLNTAFAGNFSGALTLAKSGTATFTLGGSNLISGSVFVDAGALMLSSGAFGVNNYCSIGHVGSDNGTLTLAGTAIFTNSSDFNVGDVGAAIGTFNIQGAASLMANAFYVGSANATGSTASGTVNQTGGTVVELGGTAGTFCVGGRTSGTSVSGVGVYNLSGGTLSAAAPIAVGMAGTGTFNQSGGTVTASGGVNIADLAGSSGTYNLDGGTLQTLGVVSSSGGNAALFLNGGVLMPLGNNSGFMTNVPQVYVRNGGAVVDTTNFTVTINESFQHSYLGGDNAIDGGLTKRGAGTLMFTGPGSYYTGPTTVTGGTLNLAAGSVGNLNNLTVNNAVLSLGLSGGATAFSAAGLTLAGNSTLNLNYGLISSTPVTAVNASGSLAASGTTVINLDGYGFTVGRFPLITYTGTPLPNLNNIQLGALPVGVVGSLSNDVANASIDFVVTAANATNWVPLLATDPAGTSSFSAAGEWQNGLAPAAGDDYYVGGGTTALVALRSPADTNAYLFAGDILAIDAGGRFILKGAGGQSLTVPDLVLSGGLLDYANAGDNFTETFWGNINLYSGTTSDLGALSTSTTSETFFLNSDIAGSGSLQLGGASVNSGQDGGVVVFGGTNTYTGPTTVATGTLLVNGVNGNSTITVGAAATLGGTGAISAPVTVQAGGNLAPGTPTRGALTAATGALTVNGTATIYGTVTMKINPPATPASDRLISPAVIVNPGAVLVVTDPGSTNLTAGETFTLFSTPITGSFSTVTLPALSGTNLFWTNNLALNGTIAVVAATTINPNSTNLTATVNSGVLTLSWPSDHTGWTLQAQTNSLAVGLGTNWVDVAGSTATNSVAIPVDVNNGAVFYRLKL